MIYAKKLNAEFDPKSIKLRESRDSTDNPASTAIVIGLDVTGSMGNVLNVMAKNGLNTIVKAIYDRKPVSNPHVMCMAVGDIECDSAPLQVTQFEADIRIAKQLENLYLEQGGGANSYESYTLPWLFAAQKTSIDCFEKRKKKGYLFTVGDEDIPPVLRKQDLQRHLGGQQKDYTAEELYAMVREKYHVFHILVEEGSNYNKKLMSSWSKVLGQRAIRLSNHKLFPEVLVSAIQVSEGSSISEVAESWKNGATARVVNTAMEHFNLRAEM
jgi:hypothetical protein